MKRRGADINKDATCLQCHQALSYDAGYRSQSWYRGILGARAVLCSPVCVTEFDNVNLKGVTG